LNEATDTAPLRAELERVQTTGDGQNVLQLLDRMKPELEKALPRQIGVERFTRTVLTEIRRTPKLLEAAPESLLGAMMLAAQLGLEPGPLGLVYFVPFKREVQFIVGYRGFVELAYRTGLVKDVSASLVHEGDTFDYREGTRPYLDHVPMGPADEREIIAAYAVARLKSGGAPFRVIYEQDWLRAKKASAAGDKGPWGTDFAAMVLKTAYRRLEPKLPKSPLLSVALDRDEAPAPTVAEIAEAEDE
jgi:recombination protein RecT